MGKLLPDVIKGAEKALGIDFVELQNEIADGLQGCVVSQSKKYYCYRLLKPFGLNSFIDVHIPPVEQIKQQEQIIKQLGDVMEQCPDEKIGKGIDRHKQEIKNIESTPQKFWGLLQPNEKGELIDDDWVDCYRTFTHIFKYFGIVVDWVLMLNNIDLLRLQKKWGIYIISKRRWIDYVNIAGSKQMAKSVIENIEHKNSFPIKLDKPDVGQKRKLFNDCIIDKNQQQKVESILLPLGEGCKGKRIAIIVKAAMTLGLITQPTYEQAKDLWGKTMGSASGYNKQIKLYTGLPINDDVKAVMQAIKQALK